MAEGEVRLLRRTPGVWGGPARYSDQLAFGVWFADARDPLGQCDVLRDALGNGDPLKLVDWTRTLRAVEIVLVEPAMERARQHGRGSSLGASGPCVEVALGSRQPRAFRELLTSSEIGA